MIFSSIYTHIHMVTSSHFGFIVCHFDLFSHIMLPLPLSIPTVAAPSLSLAAQHLNLSHLTISKMLHRPLISVPLCPCPYFSLRCLGSMVDTPQKYISSFLAGGEARKVKISIEALKDG